MKRLIFSGLFFLAISTMFTNVYAQDNELEGTAKAEIRKPLVIVEDPSSASGGELNFGLVNASASVGTVVLSTTNVATASGGVNLTSTTGTTVAAFAISGSVGKTYAVSFASPSATLSGTSGDALANTATMTVDNFAVRTASAGVDGLIGTLDATTGADTFVVGGTLNVKANQDEGEYEGEFVVTVAYN